MLFQLGLAKFFKSELFSSLPKVGRVIMSCKEPEEDLVTREKLQCLYENLISNNCRKTAVLKQM